jgi:CRP-like cAMP-binding protein
VQARGALHHLLGRYTHALFSQTAQSVGCNRLHGIEERCSRWLLMTHDRVESDEFALTQEYLARMLGVRRATVTEAAGGLQRAGLIRYRRGQVTIIDRAGLEATACECYATVRREFDRIFTEPAKQRAHSR